MDLEELKQIGLTSGEIKVYDALLELGESTKTPIAKRSNVSPGKIYDVLERLIRKGLASSVKKGNILHFRVANPKQLKEFIKRKKEELTKEEKIIGDFLPYLLNKYNRTAPETDAEVYKGWKGVETAYNNIIETLNKGDTTYVLGATKGADPKKTKLFFTRFNKKRYDKGIKLKIIYNEKDKKFTPKILTNTKLDTIKYINLHTPAEINIYNDKVIILILTETPLAVVISSKETAQSFKQYFDAMWSIANN